MHILLTNDDGIRAEGLIALSEALNAAGHRVSACAPDRERSAASHSGIFNRPLRAERVDFPGAQSAWQADGTPSDCASLGLYLTREDPVDMVVSGINRGMNLGGACVYSGTVGAAIEASMDGFPALAVSLCFQPTDTSANYAAAARLAARVVGWMEKHPLPEGCIYNLNVPNVAYETVKGLRAAKLAKVFFGGTYEPASDEKGICYHYRYAEPPRWPEDSDMALISRGYATITKLTWDMRMNAEDEELNQIGI